MQVLLFGPMAARIGLPSVILEPAPGDAAAVLAEVGWRFPELADLCRRSRVAVGDAFCSGPLPTGTLEVAIIPPVSGG